MMSFKFRPRPSSTPTLRLRERPPVQVRTRSPKTGESSHGFRTPAAGNHQASDLGQSAGDERGDGIVAQAQAVANTGGNGDDVLERAAQFDSDDVLVGVDAKAGSLNSRCTTLASS